LAHNSPPKCFFYGKRISKLSNQKCVILAEGCVEKNFKKKNYRLYLIHTRSVQTTVYTVMAIVRSIVFNYSVILILYRLSRSVYVKKDREKYERPASPPPTAGKRVHKNRQRHRHRHHQQQQKEKEEHI